MDQLKQNEIIKEAYRLTMQKLARREYALSELTIFLKQKGFCKEVIDTVINILLDRNYQSDQRYTEMLIRARVSKKYGPEKIKQELKVRQIDESIIQAEIRKYQDVWIKNLYLLVEKRCSQAGSFDKQSIEKTKRYLLYKGYRFDQINVVLKDYI